MYFSNDLYQFSHVDQYSHTFSNGNYVSKRYANRYLRVDEMGEEREELFFVTRAAPVANTRWQKYPDRGPILCEHLFKQKVTNDLCYFLCRLERIFNDTFSMTGVKYRTGIPTFLLKYRTSLFYVSCRI